MLKTNSKRILDIIASQESKNATQAYKQVHPTASDVTARTNAYKLLQKPDSEIYLQKHISKAKSRIVELIDSDKPDIALKASQDILDRTQGKATIKTESTNYTDINITLGKSPSTTDVDTIEGDIVD